MLVTWHWKTQQGITSLTQEQAAAIQAKELGHATRDRRDATEQWERDDLVKNLADNAKQCTPDG